MHPRAIRPPAALPSRPRAIALGHAARGIKLHLLDLGGDIAGNGLSKLFLPIAAAFAEAERDRIRERISQVKADQKLSALLASPRSNTVHLRR
jgi:hypothetical protein